MSKPCLRALALVFCLLLSPLAAQEVRTGGALSEPEQGYVERLVETYGPSERSRAAAWTLADGTRYASRSNLLYANCLGLLGLHEVLAARAVAARVEVVLDVLLGLRF